MGDFWQRLQQRKLVQWAVAYVAFAFALLQGVDIVASKFNWPPVIERGLIVALCLGFFVVLVLAWYHGERGAQRVGGMEILILALLLALGGGAMWYLARPAATTSALTAGAPTAAPATAKPFNPPADTLVVLPFANLSGDKSQQYFSDGITEELTNALGQTTGLKVIAWDTASHYRNSSEPATAVGRALNVANVLTGKILRQGNTVRVIVELVDARTGYQVWADHYDDSLANVFAVQDKISGAIAGALQVKFASLGQAPTVNPQAHDLVLKARALMDKARNPAPFEQARSLLEQAIALDPNYAGPHAGLARAWFELTQFSTLLLKEALPKVREEANKALAFDPRNMEALVVLADADVAEGHVAQARAGFERALAIDPSNARAHADYGYVLPLKQGRAQELEAVQLDPDNAIVQNDLAEYEVDLSEYAQSLASWLAAIKLDPHSADSVLGLAETYALLHRDADAVKAFDLAQPDTELAKALIAAGRLTYQSLIDPKLRTKALAAVDALHRRADLDPFSTIDVTQLDIALGENANALALLPKLCAGSPALCSDISFNPLWIPLRGKPAFEALVKQYDTVSKPAAPAAASVGH